MNEKMKKIKEILEKKAAFDDAITLLNWDLETEAPRMAIEKKSKTLNYLSGESYSTVINDEFKELVYSVDENDLNELDRKIIQEIKKETFEKMKKIPKEDYQKYSEIVLVASRVWERAKNENNYEIFKDYLKQIIEYNKKFIKLFFRPDGSRRAEGGHYYRFVRLRHNEKVRTELSPLIKKIVKSEKKVLDEEKRKKFKSLKFDIQKQKELSKEILDVMKFDFERGILKESEHPFTTDMGNKDVRITTHYYENNLLSSVYSTIHEGGHALYEQHITDEISNTILGNGTSMGIHESQSRIYENMFGRSREFLSFLYPKIEKVFDGILSKNGITAEDLYILANEVEESFIRIEADELTYPIHILIRYELEKEIFSDLDKEVDVDELAEAWADKYEKYLGIRPETYSKGILQDVHWASGLFGYFPSYALGSAYSAQIYNTINKKVNILEELKNGEFSRINEILKNNIHQFGKTKTPKEIIKDMTGKEFDSSYYIDYLIGKFSEIY